MKKEHLSDALERIDEDILQEVITARAVPVGRRWRGWVAVAACLCVLAGCLLTLPFSKGERHEVSLPVTNSTVSTTKANTTTTSVNVPSGAPLKDVKVMALASYPAMAQRPSVEESYTDQDGYFAWMEAVREQRKLAEAQSDGMTAFYADTMAAFLAGKPGENRVYSPLNVYFALGMLAETAEGNSRRQILDLLGVSDVSLLRQKVSGLWKGVYTDDGAVTCRLANSLWLAEGERWKYDANAASDLAKFYYASTYKGVMGSEMYDRVLQTWLNDQTDDLLEGQTGDLKFDSDTALALASTVCFRARWMDEFSPELTTEGVFHTANGDVTCEFLNRNSDGAAYFGDKFNAVRLSLDMGDYDMWIVLPDEEVAVDSLLGDGQLLSMLQDPEGCGLGDYVFVNRSIPKFDVVSDRDLAEGLQALGITDVFDSETADFGGILTEQTEPMYVNQVQHAARVAIDEEGVTATAYTVEMLNGTGAPMKTLDFTVDRPFLFAITGPGDTVLFTGIVENPQ